MCLLNHTCSENLAVYVHVYELFSVQWYLQSHSVSCGTCGVLDISVEDSETCGLLDTGGVGEPKRYNIEWVVLYTPYK